MIHLKIDLKKYDIYKKIINYIREDHDRSKKNISCMVTEGSDGVGRRA